MIPNIAAKKETGLSDILKDYIPQPLEERTSVVCDKDSPLYHVQKCYQQIFERNDSTFSLDTWAYIIKGIKPYVLSPADINLFLQQTVSYEYQPHYTTLTSLFITQLMTNAFLEGYDDFYLNVKNLSPLEDLKAPFVAPDNETPEKKPKVKLTIDGDVGRNFGMGSTSVLYVIKGNVGFGPFQGIQDSEVVIEGQIEGDYWVGITTAINSTFFFHKYDGTISYSTKNCTFKTDDEETFRGLKERDFGVNNKIYLVDKDNREVILSQ